jgi:hypothetical protein
MKKRLLEFREELKITKGGDMDWLEDWIVYILRGGVRPPKPH